MTEGTELAPLPGVADLFSRSWADYRAKVWRVLGVGGLGAAVTLAVWVVPLLLAGLSWAVTGAFSIWPWVFATLVGLSAALWTVSWAQVAMMEVALEPTAQLGMVEACRVAWPKVARFSWVCILWFVVVCGGFFLFFIPGVYVGVALALAPFYCVAEGVGGLSALERCWAGARGRWWPLLWRLALIGVVTSAVSQVPYIGFILSGFAAPFALLATAQLYGDVVRATPAAEAAAPQPSGRWAFAVCALGLLLAGAFAARGALALRDAAPDLEARARSLVAHPIDPQTAQQAMDILQGGLTLENIDKAQQLVESAQAAGAAAAVSTAAVAGLPPAAPEPPAAPSRP